jgi:DNA-directed RNA polymerase subunit K/omega
MVKTKKNKRGNKTKIKNVIVEDDSNLDSQVFVEVDNFDSSENLNLSKSGFSKVNFESEVSAEQVDSVEPEETEEEVLEVEIDDEMEDEDNLDNTIEIDDEDKDIDDNIKINDKDCLYKYADRSDDEEEFVDEVFDDDTKISTNIVSPNDRITKPVLYNFERVRLLGDRTKALAMGAKPMIKNVEHLTAREVANLELKHNVIPLVIEREIPNGKKERWKLSELERLY